MSRPLIDHVTAARWFGGKGRRAVLTGLTALPWLQPGGQWPAVRSEIAEISYFDRLGPEDSEPEDSGPEDSEPEDSGPEDPGPEDSGPAERYQLVLSYYPTEQPELAFAEVTRVSDPKLGDVVAYDAVHDPAATGLLLRHLVAGTCQENGAAVIDFRPSRTGVLTADLPARPFAGQQSNTSVMYGDVAMLKLFRRLETGHNLDIEVHDQLSRAGVADVAQLYGWIEGRWGESTGADLAMLVEKLPAATDGWEVALESLRADGSGAPDAFAEDAYALGAALAHIHRALADAFPTTALDGAAVAQTMSARLRRAIAVAPALEPYVPGLVAAFDRLRGTDLSGQRVHGDFHLGQTLRTPVGWKIIDFEGEPAKSMAERRAPDSPDRDLGGMLRSFAYAAASRPGPAAQAWASTARAAFLSGYAGVLGRPDAATLAAYEADKAVYEVVYETRNRPEWVHIPLAAVAEISGGAPDREEDSK